jgi:hypothetical protein
MKNARDMTPTEYRAARASAVRGTTTLTLKKKPAEMTDAELIGAGHLMQGGKPANEMTDAEYATAKRAAIRGAAT